MVFEIRKNKKRSKFPGSDEKHRDKVASKNPTHKKSSGVNLLRETTSITTHTKPIRMDGATSPDTVMLT